MKQRIITKLLKILVQVMILFAILHSGGTTGKPKGIVLTNMNFNSLVLSELEINKCLGNGISILAIMPIFHGFGLGCTFHATLVSGGQRIILPSVNPKSLMKHYLNISLIF